MLMCTIYNHSINSYYLLLNFCWLIGYEPIQIQIIANYSNHSTLQQSRLLLNDLNHNQLYNCRCLYLDYFRRYCVDRHYLTCQRFFIFARETTLNLQINITRCFPFEQPACQCLKYGDRFIFHTVYKPNIPACQRQKFGALKDT